MTEISREGRVARALAAEIMVKVRQHRIDRNSEDEAQDEFEALTLVPLIKAVLEPSPDVSVSIPREAYDFLMGTAPLEGVWFGELHDGLPGAFWWRGVLATAAGWPAPPTGEPA